MSWITLYRPTNTTFRIDYTANTTGSERVGYVNVKDGNATVMTYRVSQSASMTVKLDCNGGNFGSYQGQTVKFYNRDFVPGQKYGTLPTPVAPSGTTFDGWYTAKTGGSKITSNSTVNISYETLYARWLVKVRLDCNGGNLGSYQGQEVKISDRSFIFGGTYSDLPQPVAPDGYKFVDWYTAKSGGKKITSADKVTDVNITTLYARWTPQTYTVTFDSQGGSSVPKRTVTYNSSYGTSSNQLPNPSRSDYEFDGWYTASGAKINYYTTVTTASDHTLYAHWLNTYTIKFDPNGGSGAPGNQTKTHGKDLTISPTCPKRTGYEFKGWGTSSIATKVSYAPGAKYTTNAAATLYAVWEPLTFKVYFKDEDGETHFCTGTATYGKPYGTLPKATKAGYKQAEWYTEKTGGTRVTSETIVTIAGNHRLYARWTLNQYEVKYDANGGKDAPADQKKIHGTNLTLTNNIPTRNGYTFLGWAYNSAAKVADFVADKINTYKDNKPVTLYAVWEKTTYTICYYANKGVGGPEPQIKYQDQDIVLSTVEPKRDGYTFLGWGTSEDAAIVKYKRGETHTYSENASITLYAIWHETIWVTYDVNGGDPGSGPAKRELDLNKSLHEQIAIMEPTREGYTFFGWNTDKSGKGEWFIPGEFGSGLVPTEDKTLFAIWNPDRVNINMSVDRQGYIYPIEVYVLPEQKVMVQLDIPSEYWGYYKVANGQASGDGTKWFVTYKETPFIDYVKEFPNIADDAIFVNPAVTQYYLEISNSSNEPRYVYIEFQSYLNKSELSYTPNVYGESVVWRCTAPIVGREIWEVYISPELTGQAATAYDFIESLADLTIYDFLRKKWISDGPEFILDALGGIPVPIVEPLSKSMGAIFFMYKTNKELREFFQSKSTVNHWLTSRVFDRDNRYETRSMKIVYTYVNDTTIMADYFQDDICVGNGLVEEKMVPEVRKLIKTDASGNYLPYTIDYTKTITRYGVHYTVSGDGEIMSDDISFIPEVGWTVTEKESLKVWERNTISIRPGAYGYFDTSSETVDKALSTLNYPEVIRGTEFYFYYAFDKDTCDTLSAFVNP